MNNSIDCSSRPHPVYRLFRFYLRWAHDRFYYRRSYYLQTNQIPADGTPLLIVANHQNGLNDALAIFFSFRKRRPYFITRADIFSVHPLIRRFLNAIRLLPAFRMAHEGEEALSNNQATFEAAGSRLLQGNTVVIFPEGEHQGKHWLADFSLGYTKLAFEAAEAGGFEKDIFILPSCNHYSDYFRFNEQVLVKYGQPISLQPYYELYKTKPRTAQREVNKRVREQINTLMLNIKSVEHYEAINFLRNTYGKKYAHEQGYSNQKLEDRLITDRQFVAELEGVHACEKADSLKNIYQDSLFLKKATDKININDEHFETAPSWLNLIWRSILLLLGLPIGLFSLWPHAFSFILAPVFSRRLGDHMLYGTIVYASMVLITIPLLYPLSFILALFFTNLWIALIYFVSLPFFGLFAWYYTDFFHKTIQAFNYQMYSGKQRFTRLQKVRKEMHGNLDTLIKVKPI